MKFTKYAFLIVGFAMLFGTFKLYSNTQEFLSGALITNGTVIEMIPDYSSDSVTFKPVVEFTTDNGQMIEFASSTSSNPPAYFVGEIVDILYEESQPNEAKINSFFSLWGSATILGSIGAIFFLIGSMIIVFGSLKSRKIRYLKEYGVEIIAKYQGVELNHSIAVNGRHPFQIHAQWKNPPTSELHIFKSENIWFDPFDYINTDEITVLIERNNPKKYYMNTSFLPKLAR